MSEIAILQQASFQDAAQLSGLPPERPLHITITMSGCTARIGYVTPNDMLTGRQGTIHAERDRKLEEARQQRRVRRSQADRPDALATEPSVNHREVQILAS
jgi:hypothetical protein